MIVIVIRGSSCTGRTVIKISTISIAASIALTVIVIVSIISFFHENPAARQLLPELFRLRDSGFRVHPAF